MGDEDAAPVAHLTHIFFQQVESVVPKSNEKFMYVRYEMVKDQGKFPGWGWFDMAKNFNYQINPADEEKSYYRPDLLEKNLNNASDLYDDIIRITTDDDHGLKYSIFALALTSYNDSKEWLSKKWDVLSLTQAKSKQNIEDLCDKAWKLQKNFIQRLSKAKLLMATNIKMFTEHEKGTGPNPRRYRMAADRACWLNRDKERSRTFAHARAVIDYPHTAELLTMMNASLRICRQQLAHSAARQTFPAAVMYVQQQMSGCVSHAQFAYADEDSTPAHKYLIEAGEVAEDMAHIMRAAEFVAMLAQTVVEDEIHERAREHAERWESRQLITIPNQATASAVHELNLMKERLDQLTAKGRQQSRSGQLDKLDYSTQRQHPFTGWGNNVRDDSLPLRGRGGSNSAPERRGRNSGPVAEREKQQKPATERATKPPLLYDFMRRGGKVPKKQQLERLPEIETTDSEEMKKLKSTHEATMASLVKKKEDATNTTHQFILNKQKTREHYDHGDLLNLFEEGKSPEEIEQLIQIELRSYSDQYNEQKLKEIDEEITKQAENPGADSAKELQDLQLRRQSFASLKARSERELHSAQESFETLKRVKKDEKAAIADEEMDYARDGPSDSSELEDSDKAPD